MIEVRMKAAGGWIDVSYDGARIVMAAVGPPLIQLVKEPAHVLAGRFSPTLVDDVGAESVLDQLALAAMRRNSSHLRSRQHALVYVVRRLASSHSRTVARWRQAVKTPQVIRSRAG